MVQRSSEFRSYGVFETILQYNGGMMKLLGWDFNQWAICLARYPLETKDFEGANKSQCEWKINHHEEPGEIKLINIKPPKDFEAARTVFTKNIEIWQRCYL